MITIQSAMLVLLGVLVTTFVVFVLAPAYRRRIERMAVDALKRQMPLTELEIAADKDRLRAEYAIRMHKLTLKVRDAEVAGARQIIELNRRDARIGVLETDLENYRAQLEEAENARRVLEQTIEDRLPKVEQRLVEAKKLIFNRDRDIAQLSSKTERTVRALDEAMQINAQQRAELTRLAGAGVARGSNSYGALADPRYDAEVALKAEIEALRSQSREQQALIQRLQSAVSGVPGDAPPPNIALLEAERLKRDQREPLALPPPAGTMDAALKADLDAVKADNEAQATEIKRLKAELAVYRAPEADAKSLSVRDSKIALKAKVGSLQSQVDSQTEAIKRLRAELAAANERLARQATYFTDEMRRLGAGSVPTSTPPGSARRAEATAGNGRTALRDRLQRANPAFAERMAPPPATLANRATEATAEVVAPAGSVAETIKALGGEAPAPPAEADAGAADARPTDERRRGRLVDRIADAGKS